MSFTEYEIYHLHENVDKKGVCYIKSEVDEIIDTLKTEIL